MAGKRSKQRAAVSPMMEYGAPVPIDGSKCEEEAQKNWTPANGIDDWIACLNWEIRRVEGKPDSRFEHDDETRLAIAVVLHRSGWIKEHGCRGVKQALARVSGSCREAIIRIRQQRADEQARFAPVFARYRIPVQYHRTIINALAVAMQLGRLERRRVAMRSNAFRDRQKRERGALDTLARCLSDEKATDRFRKACADRGISVQSLQSASRLLKFWERHEGKPPRQDKRMGKRGTIAEFGRRMAVEFLAEVWEALGRTASASYDEPRGDRRTRFVQFVDDCSHAAGAEEWFKASKSLGRSIANDLDQRGLRRR
jgi:hypothetical protein